jgi:predicted component of type VI protein secretion system
LSASLQVAIYQLSKAGQALDGGDFDNASQVLDEALSKDWITNTEKALLKVQL